MRLNRVLLLAATFSMMIFAMVFTISCSGDDGKNGKNGKSCTLEGSGSPSWDVMCDNGDGDFQKIGVLSSTGTKGDQGDPGPKGDKGDKGEKGDTPKDVCVLGERDPITGNYGIICGTEEIDGGEVQGSLDQCSVITNKSDRFLFIIKCGKVETYVCGGQPFDAETDHCEEVMVLRASISETKSGSTSSFSVNDPGYITGTSGWVFVGKVVASLCNGKTYDSRSEFCDDSPTAEVVKPLCGTQKEKYRTGDGDFGNEDCSGGKVIRTCGSAKYTKATQFCMEGKTIKERCGIANATGIYSTGKKYKDVNSMDMTWKKGLASSAGTLYIGGEYSEAEDDVCVDDLVVKKCADKFYDERTHFCAVGDEIAPHCTDRQIYNPTTKYCSFMGSSDYNTLHEYYNHPYADFDWNTEKFAYHSPYILDMSDPSIGSYVYAVTGLNPDLVISGTDYRYIRAKVGIMKGGFFPYSSKSKNTDESEWEDPYDTWNQKWISTAVEYCGTGTGTVNKPNFGSWKWEYCIRDNKGAPTIIRCGPMQIPELNKINGVSGVRGDELGTQGSGNPWDGGSGSPFFSATTCKCIDNAVQIGTSSNGCRCDDNSEYEYDNNMATGRYLDRNEPLRGGKCVPRKCNATTNLATNFCGANCNSSSYSFLTDESGNWLYTPGTDNKCVLSQCILPVAGLGSGGEYLFRCLSDTQCIGLNTAAVVAAGKEVEWANGQCSFKCGALHKTACKTSPECITAGGFWDMGAATNKCKDSAADCVKGSVSSTPNICAL